MTRVAENATRDALEMHVRTSAPCALCKYPDEEVGARLALVAIAKQRRQGRRASVVLCPSHMGAWRSFLANARR